MENPYNTNEKVLCKHCKTEIPAGAKICPNCRKKQKGGVGKWIAIVFGAIIVLAAIGSIGSSEEEGTNGTVASTENQNDANNNSNDVAVDVEEVAEETVDYLVISSTDLIKSYNENQVKCKQDYDNKMLKVTGTVTSIGTDILEQVYVCLGSDEEYSFLGIQCYAKDKDTESKIAELKEGDVITVTGKAECGSLNFSLKGSEIE